MKLNQLVQSCTFIACSLVSLFLLVGCGNGQGIGFSSSSGTAVLASTSAAAPLQSSPTASTPPITSGVTSSLPTGSNYCGYANSNLTMVGTPFTVPANIVCDGKTASFTGIKFSKYINATYKDSQCSQQTSGPSGEETNFVPYTELNGVIPNGRQTDVSSTACQPVIDINFNGQQLISNGFPVFVRYAQPGWDNSTGGVYAY